MSSMTTTDNKAFLNELARLVGQSSVQKSVLSAYGDQGGFVLAPQDNLF